MRDKFVLDTGPLLLYFAGDARVKDLLDEAFSKDASGVFVCDVVLAELYYKTCEVFGREVADLRYASLRESGLTVVATDEALTRDAGGLKCLYRGRLSLADAFVLAVARRFGGVLVTTDHVVNELEIVKTRLFEVPGS